jgi:hypothetical protein
MEEIIKIAWARAATHGEGPKLVERVADVHEDLHKWDKEVLKNSYSKSRLLRRI